MGYIAEEEFIQFRKAFENDEQKMTVYAEKIAVEETRWLINTMTIKD